MQTDHTKIIISGVGCALADFLHTSIDFTSPGLRRYLSKTNGDGGLSPGKLVFAEELERFAQEPFRKVLVDITGKLVPDTFNLGGPGLVSLIHASQILEKENFKIKFYGIAGRDGASEQIFKALDGLPINTNNYITTDRYRTPITYVLSDPSYNNGEGERTFINNIGAASYYTPDMLDQSFFDSDITCFGGTALVPPIHDNLTVLLQKAKTNGCITVVNTVYDFRSERKNPRKPWPLVDGIKDFKLIDVLVMDMEESLRISGREKLDEAIDFYIFSGIPSFIITNGPSDVIAYSNGELFKKSGGMIQMPISNKTIELLVTIPAHERDTTGCGDNFAGGVIASLAKQLKEKPVGKFDLKEAVSWGIASGGFACCYSGGTYYEKYPGEKLGEVQKLLKSYESQNTL